MDRQTPVDGRRVGRRRGRVALLARGQSRWQVVGYRSVEAMARGRPKLLWKLDDVGQGFSAVTVSRKTVYVTGEKDNVLHIFALDLSGKRKWQAELGAAWTANYPAPRSVTVDATVHIFSPARRAGCFDTRTGRQIWTVDAGQFGGKPGGWGYSESPLSWKARDLQAGRAELHRGAR